MRLWTYSDQILANHLSNTVYHTVVSDETKYDAQCHNWITEGDIDHHVFDRVEDGKSLQERDLAESIIRGGNDSMLGGGLQGLSQVERG